MVNIKKMLVSSRAVTSGTGNPCNYIVIHETANTSKGANAYMHAKLQRNGFSASWHYTADDKEIYQSYPDNVKCWHAGDSGGIGNGQGIGIEICVNSDGDFKKAAENAAELVKHLMKKHNIPQKNVIQHNRTSTWGKNCPANLRNGTQGVTWSSFNSMISGASGAKSEPAPEQKTKSSTVSNEGVQWVGTDDKGKRLEAIVSSVNYYDTQRWSNPTGSYKKGEGWIIDNLYRVNGSLQYRVQNSNGDLYYTTARKDLVKIVSESSSGGSSSGLPNATYYVKSPLFNGSGVRAVQEALASIYFFPEKGAPNNGVDGYYGDKTAGAVRRYQSTKSNLKTDGDYGPATKAELEKDI
ncbi:N-acetylmuramoyl-L-alanine amidase [Virgibacillus sp. CBA3643]|uniref:peptidoglycan recognition protein family protein n=1 Tax=Virgibacillus sp. CBA3643 TaxID=2942278 RepID=UPI0035A319B8